jgi:hypothetical protein
MSRHLIYAVICNTSGGMVSHYLKRFEDRRVFDGWCKMTQDSHCTVVRHWTDRPPCAQLAAIKQQYKDSWMP